MRAYPMTAGGELNAAAGATRPAHGSVLRLSRGEPVRLSRAVKPARGSRRADAEGHDPAAIRYLCELWAVQAGTSSFGGRIPRWIDRL